MVRNIVKVEVIEQRDNMITLTVEKRLNDKRNNSTQMVTVEEWLEVVRKVSSPQYHGVIGMLLTHPFSKLDSSAACNAGARIESQPHTLSNDGKKTAVSPGGWNDRARMISW